MIDMTQYGFTGDNGAGDIARVTAVHKERYAIVSAAGEGYATLKAASYYSQEDAVFPTTGDFARILPNPDGDSRITHTLPRRSFFARSDYAGHAAGYAKTIRQQAVAANFDTVFILSSLNHEFSVRRMERYLAMTRQSGAEPVIVLTKADLTEDASQHVARMRALSQGARVLTVSSLSGEGLAQLDPWLLPGKTLVFLGSSGVGKSTLLNALAGETLMDTGGIRLDDSKGRHTTTHRQLFRLRSGAMVIDTPGMRELGLWNADEGLIDAFADIEALITRCRFSDCAHKNEPGCAVRAALDSGELAADRWESYINLKREMRFVSDHAARDRARQAFGKKLARHRRQINKLRGGD